MNKDNFLFNLGAITRQVTCMNEEDFKLSLNNEGCNIRFIRYHFADPGRTEIVIKMKKIKSPSEEFS